MCSDIELLCNLLMMTKYITELFNKDFDEYFKCSVILTSFSKFKYAKDIKNLNNMHINNAIQELLKNEHFMKIIKKDTQIDIDDLK